MNRREGGEGVRTHMEYTENFEKIAERRSEAEKKRAAARFLLDTALAWMGMTVAAPMAAAGLGAAGLAGAAGLGAAGLAGAGAAGAAGLAAAGTAGAVGLAGATTLGSAFVESLLTIDSRRQRAPGVQFNRHFLWPRIWSCLEF